MKSVDLELLGQKITLKVQGDPETIQRPLKSPRFGCEMSRSAPPGPR